MTNPTPETLRDRVAAAVLRCIHGIKVREPLDGHYQLADAAIAAIPKLSPESKETLLRLVAAEERDCMRAPMGVARTSYEQLMREVRAELERLP